jgi:hypothetical protein
LCARSARGRLLRGHHLFFTCTRGRCPAC